MAVVVGVVLLRTVPTPKAPAGSASTTTTTVASPSAPDNSGETTTTTAPATLLPPSKVTVLVANGTSVPAGATNMVNALKQLGYLVLVPYDTTSAATASAIYYQAGYKPEAEALATLLSQPASEVAPVPSPLPVRTTLSFDVMVVEGPALATRFANPVSLAKSTTTSSTSPSSTATTTGSGA